jgi:pantothenate kinase type III
VWTLDVGNSRGKLRRWRSSSATAIDRPSWRQEGAPAASDEWPLAELFAGLSRALDAETNLDFVHAAVSCVASKALEQSLAQLFEARLSRRALGSPHSGLENLCQPPEDVGRDRLFAARGALERLGRSALVVDIGSALTVDLVRAAGGSSATRRAGAFCGGAIAPGPALLTSSLHQLTARLPAVDVHPPVAALGRSTKGAISSGVFHGLRGAVRELVERLGAEAGEPSLPVVVSGGAAAWVLDPPLFVGREVQHEPDLVHFGLLHAALDGLPALANGETDSPSPRGARRGAEGA